MRVWCCLPWLLSVACAEGAPAGSADRARNEDIRRTDAEHEDQGGMEVVDASTTRRMTSGATAADAGPRAQAGKAGSRAPAGGTGGSSSSSGKAMSSQRPRDAGAAMSSSEPARELDAGIPDAGEDAARESTDSGVVSPAAPMNTGSCCSANDAPGCGDSALQACVCALSPRCCSDAWDESCARLVREKNCQPGVRDCVCGNAEGQWQQAYCCEGGWNATCESVSIHKCGATAACP